MINAFNAAGKLGFAAVSLSALVSSQAVAGPLRSDFVATCENGRSYPVRARAVTDRGELVTGDLLIGRHGAAHVRLMPVGFGYRYAAAGVWLDGWRRDGDLNFSKNHSVACTVDSR
jgi:hypothetical protein